jgi:hypothetical protein
MTKLSFEEFKQQSLHAGFDEVLERQWAANTVLDTHTHPFSVKALVTQGEMWLMTEAWHQHLTPGCTFELVSGTPHSERYGAEGATYWVARKNS